MKVIVREILTEFSKAEQAAGRPLFRLAQALFPFSGPALTMIDGYDSFAELDNVSRERASRASELRAKLSGTLRQATEQRLNETILPYSQ